ncbi:EboA domain-containing protein [Micromonospora tarensis]|uniref:EboA domain-containing protein n=1 Tax=Micromonospora tarensis TaxID=2806100 RepID=UPI001EE497D1|nr:EboA domain-containing protein [Micromonospora tarensis]
MTPDSLRAALRGVPDPDWLDTALRRVTAEPTEITRLFPAAGRRCGRGALPDAPGWTADDAARVLLLTALPATTPATPTPSTGTATRPSGGPCCAPCRCCRSAPPGCRCCTTAIRTNDTRLVAAALGPYARHLDPAAWRQAVLKCVFSGVPLAAVADLDARADGELATMLAALAEERHAAGRDLPADATDLLHRLTAALPREA